MLNDIKCEEDVFFELDVSIQKEIIKGYEVNFLRIDDNVAWLFFHEGKTYCSFGFSKIKTQEEKLNVRRILRYQAEITIDEINKTNEQSKSK